MAQNSGSIQTVETKEIDLVELFFYLRSKLIIIIAVFLVGAVGAGLWTHYCITPIYTATAKLYVVSASDSTIVNLEDLNLGTSLSADYKELLKTRPICNEVIEDLELDYSYKELTNMITIESIDDTRILTITVNSTSPTEARDIANSIANKAVTYLPKLMETSAPNIAEEAVVPTEKSSPSLSRNTMMGGLLGLVIVIGIFTVLFLMDDTVKTSEDIEKLIGVMPLTVIPESTDREKNKDKHRKGYGY